MLVMAAFQDYRPPNIVLNTLYLNLHKDFFPENLGAYSDEYDERFHQDISDMEDRFNGRYIPNMLGEYCWSLLRDTKAIHKTKETFLKERLMIWSAILTGTYDTNYQIYYLLWNYAYEQILFTALIFKKTKKKMIKLIYLWKNSDFVYKCSFLILQRNAYISWLPKSKQKSTQKSNINRHATQKKSVVSLNSVEADRSRVKAARSRIEAVCSRWSRKIEENSRFWK